MSLYSYRGVNTQGSVFTGQLEAENSDAVRKTLSDQGVIPLSVKQTQKQFLWLTVLFRFRRVRTEELVLLTRQFYTLFKSGVGMKILLNTLVLQTQNKTLRNTLQRIQSDVVEGSTLSKAFAKHPDVFSELYVSMIAAGEEAGILEDVLHNLTIVLEKEVEIRNGIKSATLYPKIVLFVLSLAVAVMLAWIIPKFQSFYAHYKAPLPLPTQILVHLSDMIRYYGWVLLLFGGILYAAFQHYYHSLKGKFQIDRLYWRIPIFGILGQKIANARFAYLLAALYKSGLSINRSLALVESVIENEVMVRDIRSVRTDIEQGKSVAEAMRGTRSFFPILVESAAIGEKTGSLDEMLRGLGEHYDIEIRHMIKNLSTLLEPILLFFIFGMVAFFALSIFLPIWNISRAVIH